MRSSEIANIAGVSTRTLRHYHALELLAEPPRKENGYREYSVFDLARVLQIKRLAALGFSLAHIKDMLDQEQSADEDTPHILQHALDELDHELALEIKRLKEQRRVIKTLREEGLDPSVPVRFSQIVNRLYGRSPGVAWIPDQKRASAALTDADKAALLISAHFYDEENLNELERVTHAFEENDILDELRELEH